MSGIWNLWDTKPPPVCNVKTPLYLKEMLNLDEIALDALQTLKNLCFFNKEVAILSRFLYKYKRIFRHEKGMHNLIKINQCLKRYLKLDMLGVFLAFKQSLPTVLHQTSTHAFLPTRQMIKWVLLRLQAFSQIFVRVIELAKEVGRYVYSKLLLRWSFHMSVMIFSLTGRILATAKYLVAKSIEWYSVFYKTLPFVIETSEFLSNYNFPSDLKQWLGKVDLSPLQKKTFFDEIFEFIDLAQSDEDDDNEVTIVNEKFIKSLFNFEVRTIDSDVEEIIEEKPNTMEEIIEIKQKKKGVKRVLPSAQDEDLGVPVDDEEVAVITPPKKKLKKSERKRLRMLKKMKNTINELDKAGSSHVASDSQKNLNDSCIIIE